MEKKNFKVCREGKDPVFASAYSAASAVRMALGPYAAQRKITWKSSAMDESYDEYSVNGEVVRVEHDVTEVKVLANQIMRAGFKVEIHPTMQILRVQDPVQCSHGQNHRWTEYETVDLAAVQPAVTKFLLDRS